MKISGKLILLLYILTINPVLGQEMISIELDSIHCNDEKCYFLNFSDDNKFVCGLYAAVQTENRYKYILDCYQPKFIKTLNDSINSLSMLEVTDINDFRHWISKVSFSREHPYKRQGSPFYYSIDENYGIINWKIINQDSTTWRIKGSTVFQIIPIRVNNKYFVGGLREMNDDDINVFIIPTKDNKGIMFNYRGILYPSNPDELHDPGIYKHVFNDFIVREKNKMKTLTNSTSTSLLLNEEFDMLTISYPFVIAQRENNHFIYNKKLQNITPERLVISYPHNESIQMIVDDKIKWIDKNENTIDTMPRSDYNVCTTGVPCEQKYIINQSGTISEVIQDCYRLSMHENEVIDTFQFNIKGEITEIRYLNNKVECKVELYGYNCIFCHDINLYYFKKKNGNEGIFRHINEKSEKRVEIQNKIDLSYKEKRKLLKSLNDSLITTYRDEIVFEGKFAEFKVDSHYKPIVFKQNDLYGFFPVQNAPKYISISEFKGFFAKVTFKNGNKGWVDIYGNEYNKRE